jgi:hypothetical protein
MILGAIHALDVLNAVGSIASIAALVVAIYVAYRVRRIERSYVRQAMLPDHEQRLKGLAKNLEWVVYENDAIQARIILEQCRALVGELSELLPVGRRDRLLDIQRTADAIIRSSTGISFSVDCERFAATLLGELESLASFERAAKWRRRDDQ